MAPVVSAVMMVTAAPRMMTAPVIAAAMIYGFNVRRRNRVTCQGRGRNKGRCRRRGKSPEPSADDPGKYNFRSYTRMHWICLHSCCAGAAKHRGDEWRLNSAAPFHPETPRLGGASKRRTPITRLVRPDCAPVPATSMPWVIWSSGVAADAPSDTGRAGGFGVEAARLARLRRTGAGAMAETLALKRGAGPMPSALCGGPCDRRLPLAPIAAARSANS